MAALTVRMCGYEMTPPGSVRRGRWFGVSGWCSVRRDFGDGGAGGGFVDDGFVGGEGGDEAWRARLLTARG